MLGFLWMIVWLIRRGRAAEAALALQPAPSRAPEAPGHASNPQAAETAPTHASALHHDPGL
jgi:hypothetical protein